MKTIFIILCLSLLYGCTLYNGATISKQIPFRLDYEIACSETPSNTLVSVTHRCVNVTEKEIMVCTLPEGLNYKWIARFPTDPNDLIIFPSSSRCGGTIGCPTDESFFRNLSPQDSFNCIRSFYIPKKSTTLEYQASWRIGRNGSKFGLDTWTGEVFGSSVTIKVK